MKYFLYCLCFLANPVFANEPTAWVKHVLIEGEHCNTAVAADFTGDGTVDVISNSGGKCYLISGPDFKSQVIYENKQHSCIHSECMDVDHDGDMDYIAARYNPGLIYWLENTGDAAVWNWHLVDDQVNGIHGLLVGDVNLDGKPDLIANSAQPHGDFPESIVWYDATSLEKGEPWERIVFAKSDAPGLTHYMGLGDLNSDGRPDIMVGAKGGPQAEPDSGDYFAWWEAPQNPKQASWKKHLISRTEPGATNILPADVDNDGVMDMIASRGHGKGLCWFKGPAWERTDFASDLEGPHCLTVNDLDGDGDLDAATCAKDSKVTAWFENDGSGNFKSHILDDNQSAYDIRSLDMDGDKDLDLLVAGQSSKNVVWYENRMSEKR